MTDPSGSTPGTGRSRTGNGTDDRDRDVVLRTDDLRKVYADTVALDGVSLTVERGEFFSLLGPSGCGKTTLLRIIAGLERPTAGDVVVDGRSVTALPASERDSHMVFQDLALFPHMTVAENVAYGLRRAGVDRTERERRVREALELIGLPEYGKRDPAALSGGQRQRVALARSLVTEPALLLLDEPLSSLDRQLRQDLQVELQRVQSAVGTTFLYVTHNQDSAMSVSDRIAVMREGRIIETGTPETLYEHPRTEFVARFLGDANVLSGEVLATNGKGTTAQGNDTGETDDTNDTSARSRPDDIVRLGALGTEIDAATNGFEPSVGDRVSVIVRPEAVTIGSDSGSLGGRVLSASYKGFYNEHELELDDGTVLEARTDGDGPRPSPGERTTVDLERAAVVRSYSDGRDPDGEEGQPGAEPGAEARTAAGAGTPAPDAKAQRRARTGTGTGTETGTGSRSDGD